MENPFTYGRIVTGKYFTDRTEELADLKLDMRSGQNVVITSPRRYGKTSLVFQTMEDLTREGVLIAYVDLMLSETKTEFANSLANALYGGLVAPFDRAWKKAGDFFSRLSLRPKFTVDESGKPVVEIATAAAERDVDRILKDILALPGKVATERQKQVVVIYGRVPGGREPRGASASDHEGRLPATGRGQPRLPRLHAPHHDRGVHQQQSATVPDGQGSATRRD